MNESSCCPCNLYLAPMAGITHSAFRRIVSDFGGYHALYTEMIQGRALLHREINESPYTKKRECEGNVIYQLLLTGKEDIPRIVDKLKQIHPFGIDLNVACPAPEVLKYGSGFALFKDLERFSDTVKVLRREWPGRLSVKCRLGEESQGWQPYFERVLSMLEDNGIDSITVHPRFSTEKLKRPAQWEHLPWIISKTKLPIIVNGDIAIAKNISDNPETLGLASGYMLGRMAVVQPWIFHEFTHGKSDINYLDVWTRYFRYVCEDFTPPEALIRLRDFSVYFARNFFFGHQFFKQIHPAVSLEIMYERAVAFLSAAPQLTTSPTLAGI